MGMLIQDLRYGLRMFLKSPGFTAVAILTLAMGIGANTAIFSLIDGILMRGLPVQDPQHLVVLRWSARKAPDIHRQSSYGDCGGGVRGMANLPAARFPCPSSTT